MKQNIYACLSRAVPQQVNKQTSSSYLAAAPLTAPAATAAEVSKVPLLPTTFPFLLLSQGTKCHTTWRTVVWQCVCGGLIVHAVQELWLVEVWPLENAAPLVWSVNHNRLQSGQSCVKQNAFSHWLEK